MEFSVVTCSGDFDIEAQVRIIGSDILVAVFGGEKPHIGAVAAAQPRPSLRNPAITDATASVICFPGHKEDEIAKFATEKIAAALNTQTVVTAGIHWDHLNKVGIEQVIRNSREIVKLIIEGASSYL